MGLDAQCADTIGILPELEERVSWLPVDYAARTIVEIVNLPTSAAAECPFYHVMQPTCIPWSSILIALQKAGLRFKSLPRHDWLKALHASDPDERRNPSRKLLAFYEGKYSGEKEKTDTELCVEKTLHASRWLRGAPVVGEELVAKWIAAWGESGFLPKV